MNRAYELYLEQIKVHKTSHPSLLAIDILQAYHPDLSCPEQLANTSAGSSTDTYILIPQRPEFPFLPISEIPHHYIRDPTPPPQQNHFLRLLQQIFSSATRTTAPPLPPITEYYSTVNLDITVTPCHTPLLLNTPPLNTQNLIDPFDHYIQNQDATIVRPDPPQ
ncbi:28446_t:CDS:2 [Racocetra persica]|uniref:28446_t:CDS:1 n=2 Tax=Racocetra persica TaxID=160502 RepID=A0ACA9KIL4_9GLOM|nr:28445_t:CDS:2 [Racocetra persica]CAG8475998.1 28446_t:CDS:2 [Racocetra persica]